MCKSQTASGGQKAGRSLIDRFHFSKMQPLELAAESLEEETQRAKSDLQSAVVVDRSWIGSKAPKIVHWSGRLKLLARRQKRPKRHLQSAEVIDYS